jgi:hypothetical protein
MVPQPDGGLASTPRKCDALTIGSGQWEAWCTPSNTYVWARFDQLSNQGTWTDCHHVSLVEVDEGVYDTGLAGGNTSNMLTYEADGTSIAGTFPGMPETGILQVTVGNGPNGGSSKLFVLGSLQDSCNTGASTATVLGGVSVTWAAH